MDTPDFIDTYKTAEYRHWEDALNDVAAAAIDARLKHLQDGKKGDWSPVGDGVCELRFLQTGPGWRVYFHETNQGTLILLLLGGDKSSQKNDIKKAQAILKELKARQAALKKQRQAQQAQAARLQQAASPTGARKK